MKSNKKDLSAKELPLQYPNFVIFQTESGKVNIDVFFQNETLWLTQKKMAELFEVNGKYPFLKTACTQVLNVALRKKLVAS